MVRIADVLPGSIADELSLQAGSRIVRMNGQPVRDAIDLRFREVDERLELEVAGLDEAVTVYEIDKPAGEALGVVPAPDPVRQCANRCPFCFIDGNPAGARRSLFLKDDDFRLSFSYGSYVTLTNLGPRGFERLIEQRLSPLYVSVHATEPAVREAALGVPRGGDILRDLQRLLDAGLEVHTQVVLCPDLNDREHLERTIADLFALGPGVLSLSIVPVGLTRYNLDRPMRLLTPGEARQAITQVERGRALSLHERGTGWVYAGDEMFFLAGLPLPGAAYYDDWPLTENGVGAVRQLLDRFEANLHAVPRLTGRRITVVTGERMAPVLEPLGRRLAEHAGCSVETVAVRNEYFGGTVTTAGLLGGMDVLDTLQARGGHDVVLLPAEALNDDARFIDDVGLDEFVAALAPARVVPAYEMASALSDL
jgi:putative radical SAM enzyme (TIGR03279 family)